MTTEKSVIVRETGEIIERHPLPVKLTEEAIAITVSNIQMAERLVFKVLERGVDYGRLPGLPGESLRDPGAQKIANAFNCYPKHNVLFHEESESLISYTIEAQLIHRDSQQVVGSGIGASSTMEPKNKYRWVKDPQSYGYSEEEKATLKTKDEERGGEEYTLYRIQNPEYGELVNNIAQMAAKRAEVDAAKSLPGVGSALVKLFSGKAKTETDWGVFWTNVKGMGLNADQVHAILNVKSVKDWLASGKTLENAIRAISEHLAKRAESKVVTPAENPSEGEDLFPEGEASTSAIPTKPKRDPSTVQTWGQLYAACATDFNLKTRKQVWDELNVNSQEEITETPQQCYIKIRVARE